MRTGEMNSCVGDAIGRLDFRRGVGGATVVATRRVNKDGEGCGVRRRRAALRMVDTRRVTKDGEGCGVRRRRAALRMVDRQLEKGNFKLALSLVKQLQRLPPPAGLRGFAGARQVPRRVTSIQELHLSVTETAALQSLLDSILDLIVSTLESSPLEEGSSVTSEGNDLYLEDDIIEHKHDLLDFVKICHGPC